MKDCLVQDIQGIPILTRNALKYIGILYSAELGQLSVRDLNMIPRIGKKGRNAIIEFCNNNSIELSATSYIKENEIWIFGTVYKERISL
jgi:DNA-directed RNA polymerase alpha subunit